MSATMVELDSSSTVAVSPLSDMRDVFISRLHEFAVRDERIVFLACDFGAPSLDSFRKELPKQFLNVGIAEQNAISFAAGLALGGKKVFVYSIASFITLRCFEELKLDLSLMRLPVTILAVGACYAYSFDGPTHHASEDISILRTLPHFRIFSPSDNVTTSMMAEEAANSKEPVYLRLDRGRYPIYPRSVPDFRKGFRVLREGTSLAFVATGAMVHRAMEVAEELETKGISVKVIDLFCLKPFDCAELLKAMNTCKKVATIEEHSINGGLGSIIAEVLVDHGANIPCRRFGISDDLLAGYGNRHELQKERGLEKWDLVSKLGNWLQD